MDEPQEMNLCGGFTATSGDDVYKKIYAGLFFHFVFTVSQEYVLSASCLTVQYEQKLQNTNLSYKDVVPSK